MQITNQQAIRVVNITIDTEMIKPKVVRYTRYEKEYVKIIDDEFKEEPTIVIIDEDYNIESDCSLNLVGAYSYLHKEKLIDINNLNLNDAK